MTPEQLTGQTDTHLTDVLIGKKQFQVHHEVVRDLLELKKAATNAGFDLCIASGFRSFERQAAIWNSKIAGERPILDSDSQPIDASNLTEEQKVSSILRWSALPGASRHHWGTDFDLYDASPIPKQTTLKLEPWEYLSGHQHNFYLWLSSNIHHFGFYFPYNEERGGVAVEQWHVSHIRQSDVCISELSVDLLRNQLEQRPILAMNSVLSSLDTIYTQYITNVANITNTTTEEP
ncbi:M15 family metallopeptidase [Vibrio kyushuensis]|uniref:M15 family metallopeptidase n=1 Tax=Vibrio kyushuensis TaxID=2910249 RepID=UPI003D1442BD